MPNQPTTLDRLRAGILNHDEFHTEVLNEVYAGLHQFCQIPDSYKHCRLTSSSLDIDALSDTELKTLLNNPPTEIVNPYTSQTKAITLFNMMLSGDTLVCDNEDPLRPTLGAYLYGPPGTGKTHLMAAYARLLKEKLDVHLEEVNEFAAQFINKAFGQFMLRVGSEQEAELEETGQFDLVGDEFVSIASPEAEFWQTIDTLKEHLAGYEYKPIDLIYIGFKELFELYSHTTRRIDIMQALESARVVFIDDVHPQGDSEQTQLVLHLLERRYELGQSGTFLTTNLQTSELGGGDEKLGNRLLSRCSETLLTIDFSDCDDWRKKVKSRKIKMVEQELERQMN